MKLPSQMKEKLLQIRHSIGVKLGKLHYLHRGIVLAFDIICALLSGLMACICLEAIYHNQILEEKLYSFDLLVLLISIAVFLLFRFYKIIIRHANLQDLPRIITAVLFIAVLTGALSELFIFDESLQAILAGILFFIFACGLIIGGRILMICVYYSAIRFFQYSDKKNYLKVFVYGETSDCVGLFGFLSSANQGRYCVRALIDPDKEYHNLFIQGIPVYGKYDLEKLERAVRSRIPEAIIFTSRQGLRQEQDRLVEWCNTAGVKLFVTPPFTKYIPGTPIHISPVQIEDLLERPEIKIEEEKISSDISGQTVMVTGAAGSIGSELVRQLCKFSPAKIILLDCAETPLHLIRLEIEEKYPSVPICPIIADIRSKQYCHDIVAAHRPSIIFHAAAYKHVPLMEENPCEAVLTNIVGSINMAELARENGVGKFVMVSTDKAVNPTNVMGATKRAAEMYVQSLDHYLKQTGEGTTRFVTTRFGNVLGSNGSVVPRFREQIAKGGPVTVTHPDIVRFFMTIPEACRLVLQAATMGQGGEIFVFDMGESVKIDRLARRMIQLSGLTPDEDIKVEYTGLRPGEKLYEEVLSSVESTMESSHHKIRIAHAIDNTFEDIRTQASGLIKSAIARDLDAAIIALKRLVPEFKSKNSPWEKFD